MLASAVSLNQERKFLSFCSVFSHRLGLFSLAILIGLAPAQAAEPVALSVVSERAAPAPVRHGLSALEAALRAQGVSFEEVADAASARGATLIVAGIDLQPGPAADLARALGAHPAAVPEALLVRHATWGQKPALLVAGSDAVGLMYALLDVAERVGWAADASRPLSEVKDVFEQPAVAERGVSIYTMQQAWFEGRLHDENYWARYFDNLAKNRFNTFGLLFAYEMEGYLYPPYPYFFDVEGFPDVRVVGLSSGQQRRNLDDLNRLVRMAHDRGLKVTIGIWDHIYRPKQPTPGLVWGVNESNLLFYTKAAIAKFVHQVPDFDRLMLLMHGESGLKPEQMHDFWGAILRVLHAEAPRLPIEARAKGVPDDIIQDALKLGLDIRMNTKYWAEQAGPPYPPTHIQELNQFDRRHGYSDMLVYPRKYGLHWTLWTSGTMRVLLWGDPDYVRRFAGTVQIADTQGFDVLEPLATRMAGHPQDMKPPELLRPGYRYYDYEFERYWHFFQVFGRVSYNPAMPSEAWDREFGRRFGPDAGPLLEQGLHRASQILPRIVAYCLPPERFPTTRGWPERQRWEDLPVYAGSEPSDTQQFQSFAEAARNLLDGVDSAKIGPMETSRWFARTADDVLRLAQAADDRAGAHRNKELVSTVTDLRILARLAQYHSRRIPAGFDFALFQRTHDVNALDAAIAGEQRAIEAWRAIVTAAGDVYGDDLAMGLPEFDLSGHWKDESVKLDQGLAALQRLREAFRPEPRRQVAKLDVPRSGVVTVAMPVGSYELAFSVDGEAGPMWVEANGSDYSDTFRVAAGRQVEKKLISTVKDGKLEIVFHAASDGTWRAGAVTVTRVDPLIAHVPVRRLAPGETFLVRATVGAIAPIGQVRVVYGNDRGYRTQALKAIGPGRYEAIIGPQDPGAELNYFLEAEDQAGRCSRWPETGRVAVTVTGDLEPPQLRHTPIASAVPGKPLRIVATVSDPSGVKWVRVRYRGLTQHQDFNTREMLPTGRPGEYQAEIPGSQIDPQFDFMYLFEVMDQAGNGKIYPDLERETPYVIVHLRRQP